MPEPTAGWWELNVTTFCWPSRQETGEHDGNQTQIELFPEIFTFFFNRFIIIGALSFRNFSGIKTWNIIHQNCGLGQKRHKPSKRKTPLYCPAKSRLAKIQSKCSTTFLSALQWHRSRFSFSAKPRHRLCGIKHKHPSIVYLLLERRLLRFLLLSFSPQTISLRSLLLRSS